MKDSKEFQKNRSSSHIQLLVFPKNSDYIMDDPKEFLKKDKVRQEKFSLENLHEKWTRKGIVNFKKIDCKFEIKQTRPVLTEYKTEKEERQQKQFFDILHGIHYNPSDYNEDENNNKSVNKFIINNRNNKFDNKHSYYLTTKNPWNNNSVFEDKDRNDIDKKIKKNIKEVKLTNAIINSKNKSYKSLKERFVKNTFLLKEAKNNKFIEKEHNKLYTKIIFENPGIEKYPEKINALLFKGMVNLYQEYANYIQGKNNKNINKINYKFERNTKNNLKSKHSFNDNEIFEKMQLLLAYLKQSKINIDQKQFLQPLLLDYKKVIEKEEYLKKIDEEYHQYIEKKKKEIKKEKNINSLNNSKYPIDERTEKEKMLNVYSFHKIDKEESNPINNKNNQINYFLTAYKSVFDENNAKKKIKAMPVIITERSTNPYGTFEKLNNNKNEEIKNNESNVNINKNIKRKRPHSSYGTRQLKITYYHPGSYYLFKEGNKDYYAWSCCLNEDKFSKGCSKKYEKVLNFLYKDEL